jgi:hypothetical protein
MTITLTREEAQQVLDALDSCEWYDDGGFGCPSYDYDKVSPARETLRARLAQPEPEPVADKYLMEVECTKCGAKQDGILTVNAPPQREWQGLTEDEIKKEQHHIDWTNVHTYAKFARAIEAKLKEKNT